MLIDVGRSTTAAAPGTAGRAATGTRSGVDVVQHQVWFGPEDRPLFGWLALPRDRRVRGGVVLCPPMGEEGRATHRTFRELAEALADAGLAALRFDYDGTGDSSGRQDDPERVEAWLGSVEHARTFLHEQGVGPVSAVGMRLGATTAAFDAARHGEAEPYLGLVLWDPCVSGRRFLREGEALHQFGEGSEAGGIPDDGLRHTPGFQYDAATATGLRGLDLGKLPGSQRLAARVLLLTRDDRPSAGPDPVVLARPGSSVETDVALDQADLMDLAPSDCLVPTRAVARVVDWLADAHATAPAVVVEAPPASRPRELPGDGEGSAPVVERLVRLGPARLVGVVAEPVGGVPPGRPWVVLVNVAAEHHIGPGRRWVEFARRWALRGYRTVRVDQSGVGDSPWRPGQHDPATFTPEWIDDLAGAVAELGAEGPVVMVGLCSGAQSSFEASLWTDVAAVFAVNPRLTIYAAAKGTPLYTRRRRGAIVPDRPFAALARRHRILAGGLWRIYRQVAVWQAPFAVLRRVLRRGTRVELMACPDDAQHFTEVAWWRPALAREVRRGRLDFEATDRLDHSLLGRGAQQLVWERATAFVEARHDELARESS